MILRFFLIKIVHKIHTNNNITLEQVEHTYSSSELVFEPYN